MSAVCGGACRTSGLTDSLQAKLKSPGAGGRGLPMPDLKRAASDDASALRLTIYLPDRSPVTFRVRR
jgi:hypothetical protein